MKRLIILLYILMLVLLGATTIVENVWGTDFVSSHVYHTGWFCAVWAVLAVLLVWAVLKQRLWKRLSICLLHLSFVCILAGAFVSYLTSHKGVVHLVPGVTMHSYLDDDSREQSPLPFALQLDSFRIEHYAGTTAAADYVSYLTIIADEGGAESHERLSMNKIVTHQGYRLYQSSYDEEEQGSWLSVNYDPWGTGITYFGYALLALSMIWVLIDRREEFMRLLRHPLLQKGTLMAIVLLFLSTAAQASPRSLPAFNRQKAESLATKQVIYNDRVAPFNTLARDFVLKLYGKPSYGGLTPEQVISGWLFAPDAWQNEPMILVKSQQLRDALHLEGKYARLTDFFDSQGYRLQRLWKGGNAMTASPTDPLQKAVMETDEKVELILMLQQGKLIQPLPKDGSVVPLSDARVQAEILYNRVPFSKILFMACLTLGMLAFARVIYIGVRRRTASYIDHRIFPLSLYLCTLTLAFAFALRWYVAGHVPMSNGYETMQFMALVTLIVSSLLHRRFSVLLPFGFMVAGFCLLVAHLGQSNPQVTNLVPVLASPWLSLHVSVVMMGYSLLAFIFFTGIMGLCMPSEAERMMLMGRLLLYPAVFFLGIGIFLGAVWANQSWGAYWSWDPKETWALITFMVYAMGFHATSLPWLREPRHFHWFSVLAFLTVLMTYFGVNFFLTGMHSYAA